MCFSFLSGRNATFPKALRLPTGYDTLLRSSEQTTFSSIGSDAVLPVSFLCGCMEYIDDASTPTQMCLLFLLLLFFSFSFSYLRIWRYPLHLAIHQTQPHPGLSTHPHTAHPHLDQGKRKFVRVHHQPAPLVGSLLSAAAVQLQRWKEKGEGEWIKIRDETGKEKRKNATV